MIFKDGNTFSAYVRSKLHSGYITTRVIRRFTHRQQNANHDEVWVQDQVRSFIRKTKNVDYSQNVFKLSCQGTAGLARLFAWCPFRQGLAHLVYETPTTPRTELDNYLEYQIAVVLSQTCALLVCKVLRFEEVMFIFKNFFHFSIFPIVMQYFRTFSFRCTFQG